MEETEDDTLSTGAYELELDDEIDTIITLHLKDSTNTVWQPKYVQYVEFLENFTPEVASNGRPGWYTIFGRNVIFNTPADQSYSVNLRYVRQPITFETESEEPDIPEAHKDILILGALAQVERYRGNFDVASLYDRQVEDLCETLLNRQAVRDLSSLPRARFGGR